MKKCGWRGNKTIDNELKKHNNAYERGMIKLQIKHEAILEKLRRIKNE